MLHRAHAHVAFLPRRRHKSHVVQVHQRRRQRRLKLEALEARLALAIDFTIANWTEQGPGPTLDGQTEGLAAQNNPVIGAVEALAAHPTNADILFAGTVTGGIWRTTNATDPSPDWEPLTDQFASLTIGAIVYSPLDATNNTLFAGTGNWWSGGGVIDGGAGEGAIGLLRTTDGGDSWTQLAAANLTGLRIRSVIPTAIVDGGTNQQVVLVAAWDNGGIWRSVDGGNSFTQISGATATTDGVDNDADGTTDEPGELNLPAGSASHLAADPTNNQRFYASIPGSGVHRTDNGGVTWRRVNGTGANVLGFLPAGRIETSVSSVNGAVYAQIINVGQLSGLYRSIDQGANWTQLDTPQTIEGGQPFGLQPRTHPGGQGQTHASILADATSGSVVFLGGDRQPRTGPNGIEGDSDDAWPNSIGANNFSGRLFVVDASLAPGNQDQPVTNNFANGTSPHADSRDMVFDANGDIIQADDGGIYRLRNPNSGGQTWESVNGNLRVGQFYSVAWDALNDVVIGGTQDTGSPEQQNPGDITWEEDQQGDGFLAFVGQSGGNSIRYLTSQNLGTFRRRVYDNGNNLLSSTQITLLVNGTGGGTTPLRGLDTLSFLQPYAINAIDPFRMILGTTFLYESTDGGDNLTALGGQTGIDNVNNDADGNTDEADEVTLQNPVGTVQAFAYGGRLDGNDITDVLYVGTTGGTVNGQFGRLFLRTQITAGDLTDFTMITTYPGANVVDIALDPEDYREAFVLDANGAVWRTTDAGATPGGWTNVTGTLSSSNSVTEPTTIAFVSAGIGGADAVVVGGMGGVVRTLLDTPAAGTWTEVGGNLPNARSFDLRYDSGDDVLLVGTIGRGAWTLANASTEIQLDNALTVCGDEQFINQDDVVRLRLNPNNPSLLQLFVNNNTDDPDLEVPLGAVSQINVFGIGGNDQLIVDSSNGLITVPLGIRYNGDGACPDELGASTAGKGFDRLTFVQEGGPTQATSQYVLGPDQGSGTYSIVGAGVQTVYFEELEPIVDTVATVTHTIIATPEANAINYNVGPNSAVVNLLNPGGAVTGLVTVDNYESNEFANKTNLVINAGSGSDEVNLNHPALPTGLVSLSVDGGDPTASDTVIVNDADSATAIVFTATGASTASITGAQVAAVALSGIEHVVINGLDGVDSMTINGTALDDTFDIDPTGTGQGSLTSDASPSLTYLSVANVTVTPGAGGADLVRIRGTDTADAFTSGASTITLGGTVTVSGTFEVIEVLALGGNDSLDLAAFGQAVLARGGDGNDTITGTAQADSLLGENGHDLIKAGPGNDFVDGGAGDDVLQANAGNGAYEVNRDAAFSHGQVTTPNGAISFTDVATINLLPDGLSGNVRIHDLQGLGVARVNVGVSATSPGVATLGTVSGQVTIEGTGGDDQIFVAVAPEGPTAAVAQTYLRWGTVVLDTSGAGDSLAIEALAGDDLVAVDSTASTLTTVVLLIGGSGNDELRAGPQTTTLQGGSGNDTLVGGSAADNLNGGDGEDVLIGGAGNDSFDGSTGFDTILVRATSAADSIFVDQTASTTLAVRLNGVDDIDTLTAGSVEQVQVEAGQGDDVIAVRIADALVATPQLSLRVTVQGGEPDASDRLIVIDDGIGDLTIVREAKGGTSGTITVGPLAPVAYFDVESVDVLPQDPVTGASGGDGLGRVLVVDADPFETNDSRLIPTVVDPTCFTTAQPEPGGICTLPDDEASPNISPASSNITAPGGTVFALPGDEDWYLFRAPKIGTFRFDVFFEEIAVLANGRPGLPGNGTLAIDVYSENGTLITSGTSFGGSEQFSRGLQATFSADSGDSYFLRVRGATPAVDNIYDVNLVEVDLLGPQITDVQITTAPTFDLFDPKPTTDGPTPAVSSLTISVRDLVSAAVPPRAPGDVYVALDPVVAATLGHYRLVGDATGVIPIERVVVTNDPAVAGQIATAKIELIFAKPLPDDRFTLTIFDSLLDPAGNRLDGETNTIEPQENPVFPSGDGVSGADFVARFTVDTRAELGVYSSGSVYVDTNGNFYFDPTNRDFVNRDINYVLGFTSDNLFAGNFVASAAGSADGFDKLAAYGKVAGAFRWILDVDNDGVVDLIVPQPLFAGVTSVNGNPAAGNFDNNATNGDETVLKVGNIWLIDTNHDFKVDTKLPGTNMIGLPIVGDFDGDQKDDLGAWADDRFVFNLSTLGAIDGFADVSFTFGFAGVRERPFAGDFDGDRITDFGLWVPDRSGAAPSESAEWYTFVSNGRTLPVRLAEGDGAINYKPTPFGADLFAQFGDEFGLPVPGNFDPPIAPVVVPGGAINVQNPLDVDNDGSVAPLDALIVINRLNDGQTTLDVSPFSRAPFVDVDNDGVCSPRDALLVINQLNGVSDGEGEAPKLSNSDETIILNVTPSNSLPSTFKSQSGSPWWNAVVAGDASANDAEVDDYFTTYEDDNVDEWDWLG